MRENEVNPQREDGHVEINNITADKFGELHLSGNEWQILWVVLRKTWGFNKKEDFISLTQFQKLTKLSRDSVNDAISRLVGKSILVVDKSENTNRFSFNKHHNEWILVGKKGLVGFSPPTSRVFTAKLVGKKGHTIDNTKDNIQKTVKKYFTPLSLTEKEKIVGDLKIKMELVDEYCEQADAWSNGKGNKALNWYLTVRNWINRDIKSGKVTQNLTQEEELEIMAKSMGIVPPKY